MNLRGRNKISAEFNLSSMTDIVFLLLVFFMILTTVLQDANALDLVLPKGQGKSVKDKLVSISIDENENYFLDAHPIEQEKLEQELLIALKGETKPKFIINAEELAPVKSVVFVMDIAVRNKLTGVLATQNK